MSTSPYFADLYASYRNEIADNMTDSEGRNVMQERLASLRHEFLAYVQMMEIDPLIVAVLFYKAFEIRSNEAVLAALRLDPGKAELSWARLENSCLCVGTHAYIFAAMGNPRAVLFRKSNPGGN